MKKIFTLFAAVLLVLSFAGAALAIHAEIPAETQAVVGKGTTQITLGGEIRVRGWYYHNLGSQGNAAVNSYPQESNSKANYDQRVRLAVDIAVSPSVSGKILMETGTTSDIYSWGALNAKPAGLVSFNEAWIMHKGTGLFGFPAFIKVGHMPLKLGNGIFFDNTQYGDDAIVFAMDPTKELHIGLLTIKASEGGANAAVTRTTTVAYVASRTCRFTIGPPWDNVYVTISPAPGTDAPACTVPGSEISRVTIPAATATVRPASAGANTDNTNDLDAYVALFTYKIAPTHTIGMNYTYINQSDWALKFQNLGLHADGKSGKFGYKAEVDFQFGSIGESSSRSKFGGLGLQLNANYDMAPLNLRGSFAYGSGDNKSDSKNKEFQTLVGGIVHNAFVYDYRAATAARNQTLSGANNMTGSGIANTTIYNLGLDYKATKDIGTKFDLFLFRASKAQSGQSKNLGWELDASVTYQIAKNLTYGINAGYFKSGGFYDDEFSNDKKAATVLNNVLTLSF